LTPFTHGATGESRVVQLKKAALSVGKMHKSKIIKIFIAIIVFVVFILISARLLPPAVDWHGAFRPAALAFLRGESPYNTDGFIYPPWTALLLLPIAVFPETVGRALLFFAYLFSVAFTAYKLGGNRISILFILISPPVLHGLLNGNIDGLVVLGLVLPPWLGLFLLVIKPQVSYAAILYLFITTLKKEKITGAIRVFAPVSIMYALSLAVFGLWPIKFNSTISFPWNASLWPLSIPIGLVLLISSIRNNNFHHSIVASPFLSPYVLLHSWIGAFLGIAPFQYETMAAVIGMWLVILIRLWG
jgi:hypothetical protein